jgi:hypothetical protein
MSTIEKAPQYADELDRAAEGIDDELRAQRHPGQPVTISNVGPIEELQRTRPQDGRGEWMRFTPPTHDVEAASVTGV